MWTADWKRLNQNRYSGRTLALGIAEAEFAVAAEIEVAVADNIVDKATVQAPRIDRTRASKAERSDRDIVAAAVALADQLYVPYCLRCSYWNLGAYGWA